MNINIYGNRLQRSKAADRSSESRGEDCLASFVFVVKGGFSKSAFFLIGKSVISLEVN
jgi:hypothetical protein